MTYLRMIGAVWSATGFTDPEVRDYAESLMVDETRRGVIAMACLSFCLQVTAFVFHAALDADRSHLQTDGLLAVLSLHVLVSARGVTQLKALHLLGMVLLVVTGASVMLLAHKTGIFSSGLVASIALIYMAMPLVPWGLREASVVITLVYLLLTLSSLSVEGRFDHDTLVTLQALVMASAVIAFVLVARHTFIRKRHIRARFALEQAHRELKLVSNRDPLTGAWNRRYLDEHFERIAANARAEHRDLQMALLDIDHFKYINDNFGHHHGDTILKRLTAIFLEHMPGNAHLIRLGGDEFCVLYAGPDFASDVQQCLKHLATDPKLLRDGDGYPVRVTSGFASVPPDARAEIDFLYKAADEALYANKALRQDVNHEEAVDFGATTIVAEAT